MKSILLDHLLENFGSTNLLRTVLFLLDKVTPSTDGGLFEEVGRTSEVDFIA